MRRPQPALIAAAIALWPSTSLADVVWPALVLSGYLLSAPVIVIGLVVEVACLRLLLGMPWRRALVAGTAMNLVSCLLGVILVPLAGLVWEVFPGLVLYDLFHVGTFNRGTWVATFLMAVASNALLEASTLRIAFGVAFSRRTLGILAVANCASVSVAFVTLWLYPEPY